MSAELSRLIGLVTEADRLGGYDDLAAYLLRHGVHVDIPPFAAIEPAWLLHGK